MVKPTLLVLAAGMGSRYGSLKQMDGVGPNNEAIIDYSVYDAIRAGFGKVVFIIRKDFEAEFKEKVGKKGVVRDAAAHEEVLQNFIELAGSLGFALKNLTYSPVKGPEGNIEFLAHLSMQPGPACEISPAALVAAAHQALKG